MSYSWDEIKDIIEKLENKRMTEHFSLLEAQEGQLEAKSTLVSGRKHYYLKFLVALSTGLSAGVFTMIFNFILFLWLLHIEF